MTFKRLRNLYEVKAVNGRLTIFIMLDKGTKGLGTRRQVTPDGGLPFPQTEEAWLRLMDCSIKEAYRQGRQDKAKEIGLNLGD